MRTEEFSFKNMTDYIETIGSGTQGVVEKHRRQDNNEIVAIKKFHPSESSLDPATLRELNIFQKLKNCPTINQLIDIDVVVKKSFEIYIMMPFHQHSLLTITEFMNDRQKIIQLQLMMNQLFNALYNLYHIGVIHADIKPDNILIDIVDGRIQLFLADFGLCVQVPCETTYRYMKKPIHGSPLYMAPELLTINHYYDEKIDIWSAGITILDFLTGKYTTEPDNDLMIAADDDAFVAIIYKQFELLKNPVQADVQNYKDVKNEKFHGGIDVDLILKTNLSDEHYSMIPKVIITALSSMLQMNPKDRVHIKDLYPTTKLCSITDMVSRGEMISPMPLDEYYNVVYKMLKFCDNTDISPVTCYLSIDLLERYMAHFEVKSVKKLAIYACAMLLLNHKLYEKEELDIRTLMRMFNNEFTYNELAFAEVFILKKFNYLLTTCDTDDMIHAINSSTYKELKMYNFTTVLKSIKLNGDLLEEFKLGVINRKIIYPTLFNMYRNIEDKELYSGAMFPFELVEVYNSF